MEGKNVKKKSEKEEANDREKGFCALLSLRNVASERRQALSWEVSPRINGHQYSIVAERRKVFVLKLSNLGPKG